MKRNYNKITNEINNAIQSKVNKGIDKNRSYYQTLTKDTLLNTYLEENTTEEEAFTNSQLNPKMSTTSTITPPTTKMSSPPITATMNTLMMSSSNSIPSSLSQSHVSTEATAMTSMTNQTSPQNCLKSLSVKQPLSEEDKIENQLPTKRRRIKPPQFISDTSSSEYKPSFSYDPNYNSQENQMNDNSNNNNINNNNINNNNNNGNDGTMTTQNETSSSKALIPISPSPTPFNIATYTTKYSRYINNDSDDDTILDTSMNSSNNNHHHPSLPSSSLFGNLNNNNNNNNNYNSNTNPNTINSRTTPSFLSSLSWSKSSGNNDEDCPVEELGVKNPGQIVPIMKIPYTTEDLMNSKLIIDIPLKDKSLYWNPGVNTTTTSTTSTSTIPITKPTNTLVEIPYGSITSTTSTIMTTDTYDHNDSLISTSTDEYRNQRTGVDLDSSSRKDEVALVDQKSYSKKYETVGNELILFKPMPWEKTIQPLDIMSAAINSAVSNRKVNNYNNNNNNNNNYAYKSTESSTMTPITTLPLIGTTSPSSFETDMTTMAIRNTSSYTNGNGTSFESNNIQSHHYYSSNSSNSHRNNNKTNSNLFTSNTNYTNNTNPNQNTNHYDFSESEMMANNNEFSNQQQSNHSNNAYTYNNNNNNNNNNSFPILNNQNSNVQNNSINGYNDSNEAMDMNVNFDTEACRPANSPDYTLLHQEPGNDFIKTRPSFFYTNSYSNENSNDLSRMTMNTMGPNPNSSSSSPQFLPPQQQQQFQQNTFFSPYAMNNELNSHNNSSTLDMNQMDIDL